MSENTFAVIDWLLTYTPRDLGPGVEDPVVHDTVDWLVDFSAMHNEPEGRALVRLDVDEEDWKDREPMARRAGVPTAFWEKLEEARKQGHVFAYVKWET